MKNNLLKALAIIALLPPLATAAVWNNDSKTALGKIKAWVNINYSNKEDYKGQLIHGKREGLGMYIWENSGYHFGSWSNGDFNGYGMRLVIEGYHVVNCDNCMVHVGNWYSNKKSGKGTCYDENGNVIYYGDFSNDKPTGTYPSIGDYSEYKFQTLSWDDGDKYVGETKNGQQHGYGVYIWKSGDSWFGFWEGGKRGGNGIFLTYDAKTWQISNCENNTCSNLSSVCNVCYGSTRYNCPHCNGSGTEQMMTYQYIYGVPIPQWVNVPCSRCGGRGVEICHNCGGNGKIIHSYSSPVVPKNLTEKTDSKAASRIAAEKAHDRGVEYLKKGDYDRAIADFNEAIRLDPTGTLVNIAETYSGRGTAYLGKDYDRAIADFNEAIRLNPSANMYLGRGAAYNKKEDYGRAIADFNEAIRLNHPNLAIAYKERGYAYNKKGDYDKAISDYESALRIDPNNANTQLMLTLVRTEKSIKEKITVKSGSFTDPRDKKKYRTVKISSQTWLAENLNYKASGSKCYENDPIYCNKYGRLYNWQTAKSACPSGWHLPSDAEWTTLENMVGGRSTAGTKLKAKSGWNDNGNGTDEFGFSALPSGNGHSGGSFLGIGDGGSWWGSTEGSSDSAWRRYMIYSYGDVGRDDYDKSLYFSVRCLQN